MSAILAGMDDALITEFRSSLAVVRQGIRYLNNASVSPLSDQTVSSVAEGIETQRMRGSLAQWEWFEKMELAREECAKLIGANKEEIALMPNTSTGIIRALSSMSFKPNDEVIYLADEFPSLYWPLTSILRQKAKLVPVKMSQGEDLTSAILSAINSRTRLVALSWVGFFSGARVDLSALSAEKKRREFYLLVDGMQGIGCLPINVCELSIDFLATHGAKWMMCPVGIGFLYVSGNAQKLVPYFHGWYGHEIDWEGFLRRDTKLHSDARRFEIASPAFSLIYGLISAVHMLNELGVDFIWNKIETLTSSFITQLSELPVNILTPTPPNKRAGIVTFNCKEAKTLFEKLERSKIVVSYREGAIRVSPHFWNTEEELKELLSFL